MMPRGDRTGPQGVGPKTGRAAGYCAGYETPGYANPVAGAGRRARSRAFGGLGGGGRGRGGANGRRNRLGFPVQTERDGGVNMELLTLVESLEQRLTAIEEKNSSSR